MALAVNPGDSVSVSLVQQAAGTWQVHLTDNTTGQNVQQTIAYASSLSSAEWIEEAPSYGRGLLPLANFGTLQFSNGNTVKNGTQDTIAQAGATIVTMVSARGQVEATPSALRSDRASFTVTWSASTSTPQPGVQPGLTPRPRGWARPSPWIDRWGGWWTGGGFGETAQAFDY